MRRNDPPIWLSKLKPIVGSPTRPDLTLQSGPAGQVHRLLQAYDLAGADGLVSKKRGRPSNRRHSEDFRNLVLEPGA